MIWISVKSDLPEIAEKVIVCKNKVYWIDMVRHVSEREKCKSWIHGDPEYWTRNPELIEAIEQSWRN